MMKILLVFGLVMLLCLPAVGEVGIPNLVGNWTLVTVNGATLVKSLEHSNANSAGNVTWISKDFPLGEIMIFIKEQKGRAFTGTWMRPSDPKSTETFIGVIERDNTSIYMTNGDSNREGRLLSPSDIEIIGTENNSNGVDLIDFFYSRVK